MSVVEVRVPDMGDSKGVSVVEVLVATGSTIKDEYTLITLESDKASMDVPSPVAGVIESIAIKKGDEAAAGTLIAPVTVTEGGAAGTASGRGAEASSPPPEPETSRVKAPAPAPVPAAAPAPPPAAAP